MIAPQGISQWYLGSGGTVGFHTISGLSAIDYILACPEETLRRVPKKHTR